MQKNLIQEETFRFSLLIIELYKKLITEKEFVISKQTLRSGTSIGANVEEAIGGVSKKEFRTKMSVSLKEARETKYWLRLIDEGNLVKIDVTNELQKINSITNILYKIVKTTSQNLNKKIP